MVPGCEQAGSEKNCRRRLAGQKYRVLMQFGDQLGDFVEVTANTNDGRDAAAAVPRLVRRALVDAAEPDLRRLRAQFNNDYSQSRQARHDAKRAALDYAREPRTAAVARR